LWLQEGNFWGTARARGFKCALNCQTIRLKPSGKNEHTSDRARTSPVPMGPRSDINPPATFQPMNRVVFGALFPFSAVYQRRSGAKRRVGFALQNQDPPGTRGPLSFAASRPDFPLSLFVGAGVLFCLVCSLGPHSTGIRSR
jgi:hypothetical protein